MRKISLFSAREWLADKTHFAQYPKPRIHPVRRVSAADNQPLRFVWKNPMPGFLRLTMGLMGLFWMVVFGVVIAVTVVFFAGAIWGTITG
ncbi:hypothetical protein AQ938_07005 [Burkholderia pseudomallei]|uniref:hypothetical protein n=1 Tax=Burkholderia pseudomallei TaxID=28450 RepID=UPI00015F7CD1|nr:hypothetical protein [Burkholderia pseudomallei]EDO95501.1 hypothetical protein BURPSPAST_C1329 [Burkholderia pseudomallei Pasteur 52237]MWA16596.1 hypothetical protein [Burkholderia pseudomallei]OND79021.1 hypothetical protein AQ938_07005 [Burkholderia pseudomallei]